MFIIDNYSNGLINVDPLFELLFKYVTSGTKFLGVQEVKDEDVSKFIILKSKKTNDILNIPLILIPFYNDTDWNLLNKNNNGVLFKVPIKTSRCYWYHKKLPLKSVFKELTKYGDYDKRLTQALISVITYDRKITEYRQEYLVGKGIICDTDGNPLVISSIEWEYPNYLKEKSYNYFENGLNVLYYDNSVPPHSMEDDFKFVLKIKYDVLSNPNHSKLYRLLKKGILDLIPHCSLCKTDTKYIKLSDIIKVEFVNSFTEVVEPLCDITKDFVTETLKDISFCDTLKSGLYKKVNELTTK